MVQRHRRIPDFNVRALPQPLKENKFRIPKSRYDSVDLYISQGWMNRPEYNDTTVPYDQPIFDRLLEHGEIEMRVIYVKPLRNI